MTYSDFPYHQINAFNKWDTKAKWGTTNIDPHIGMISKFKIDKQMLIASAGSCFAQRISNDLISKGFNYLIGEQFPNTLPSSIINNFNYRVFSARYGNIYTTLQLKQLLDRALGKFQPVESYWSTDKGFYIDPFRPRIQPNGFESIEELEKDRNYHLNKVCKLMKECNIFIFTLGLTECWIDNRDNSVYPACPGRGFGVFNKDIHKFKNLSHDETFKALDEFIHQLREINPEVKIILTVSPIPLAATMTGENILLANSYSKSTLISVSHEIKARHENIEYFGSYDILMNSYMQNNYFDKGKRNVTQEGLDFVLKSFYDYFLSDDIDSLPTNIKNQNPSIMHQQIVCDEEQLLQSLQSDV